MSGDQDRFLATAEHLRSTFDRSFAQARRIATEPFEDLLAIRIGGDPYAIRLSAITGLFADRLVTPLPGSAAGLLGIAGFRGIMVPIYDLRTLLGYPGVGMPRWLVLASAEAVIGLAFDQFDGHLHLPRTTITSDERPDATRRHVHEVAQTAEAVRPVVHVLSIFAAITTRARHGSAQLSQISPSRSTER